MSRHSMFLQPRRYKQKNEREKSDNVGVLNLIERHVQAEQNQIEISVKQKDLRPKTAERRDRAELMESKGEE